MPATSRIMFAAVLSLAAAALWVQPVLAMKSNGKECTSTISEQKNPQTGEKAYTCRTKEGALVTGKKVEKAKDAPPKNVEDKATK